jgi:ribonuclease J
VIYDPILPVHVSGHASQEEIKLMYHLIRPKYLVPVHGELRHLKQHAQMAMELGMPEENIAVVENGTIIEFEDEMMQVSNRIPGGYVFVDGASVGDVGPAVVRERGTLSRDGFVSVSVLLDKDLIQRRDPEIVTRGFVYRDDKTELAVDIDEAVDEVLKEARRGKRPKEAQALEAQLEGAIRKMLSGKASRRPMLFIQVDIV